MTADLEWRTSWTAAELMRVEFPPQRWAVPGLIAEGSNLLAGPPKLGKSWLALNLGVAIASGGLALGKVPVDQGDVLYLALEDPGRRLQSRLRVVLADEPGPERLTLETCCQPLDEGGTGRIEEWLGCQADPRLVMVDVFTRVRGHVNERANRYDADYHAMATLKDLADRWRVPFLVVHHVRKQSAEDFLDTVSGTHGLAGAADAVLVLKRSRGSAEAVLNVTGRDVEEAEYALNFAADIGTWQLLDGPASDYDQSDERQRILAAVRECEGIGPKAIADASGVSYDVVKHLVRKMVDADQLDTDGSGRYFPVHRSLHSPRSPFTDAVNRVNTVNGDMEHSASLEDHPRVQTCEPNRGQP
jgi:hypothetical protein